MTTNGTHLATRAQVAQALSALGEEIRTAEGTLAPQDWVKLEARFHQQLSGQFTQHMPVRTQVLLGWIWLPVLGVVSLVALLWIYPHAERAQAVGQAVTVQWWGPDFGLTPTTSVLLSMALAATVGGVVQAGIVFGMRAGQRTLEHGYEAWYFLRPLTSALLGALFGLAVFSGLALVTDSGGNPSNLSLPAMVTMGALAGLFTDRVLQQMQQILGATDPDNVASGQPTPRTPVATLNQRRRS